MNDVGEAGDVLVALLDDGEGDDGHVHADDAAVDGLALALTRAAGTVARVTLGEQELDTAGDHNTLLHGETLLVVATGDAEDVALELIADRVAGNLSAHLQGHMVSFLLFLSPPLYHLVMEKSGSVWEGSTYALLHEDVELALILDLEELLAAIGRVGDVQLFRESILANLSNE